MEFEKCDICVGFDLSDEDGKYRIVAGSSAWKTSQGLFEQD
jgi:hypothetical protein